MKIKIKRVKQDHILLAPFEHGLFIIPKYTQIKLHTNEGTLCAIMFESFKTDMGSIPRVLRGAIPYIGNQKTAGAYLFHDFCYSVGDSRGVSRALADDMLYQMLRLSGVNRFKSYCVFKAVRIFGSKSFEQKSEIDKHNEGKYIFLWDE